MLLVRVSNFSSFVTSNTNFQKDTINPFVYTLSSEFRLSSGCVACLAILKNDSTFNPIIPLKSQLQVINLPGVASSAHGSQDQHVEKAPLESMRTVLRLALGPYLDACTRIQDAEEAQIGSNDSNFQANVPGTMKKVAELDMSLLNLQQNTEIPELKLSLHPVIREALLTAERDNYKPTIKLIPSDCLENSSFLNSLQSLVNGWVNSIQSITRTSRDANDGTASQEINFWLAMESALERIRQQLRSDGVSLTMEVLRNAKRFQATVSFDADTGLKDAYETVQKYNQLMRDFPLEDLLSASTLQKVREALGLIFAHINKKLRPSTYPIRRALSLVEAISKDLDGRIHTLMHGRSLMRLKFEDFVAVIRVMESIWRAWNENVKEFTNVARDHMRKRNDKFIPIKIIAKHGKTQERVTYMYNFRVNHEQLQQTIAKVLKPAKAATDSNSHQSYKGLGVDNFEDVDALREVSVAYEALEDVDVLDVSLEGTRVWAEAEAAYNERTARVENSIIARLRDRLATAKTSNEMFRVFSKFNALFVRPKVRGAISEYQSQLIESVKIDISKLHIRFKQQYGHSEAHAMAQMRDLPPVSGAIIWVRQIEKQLDGYMKKVEDVLGEDWALHVEGQKLRNESSMFKEKLDARPIFDSWTRDVIRRNLMISGRLFEISRNRGMGNYLELKVNFDAQVITLFKEVRNLSWLSFQVPHGIMNISKDAKRVYPYTVSLMESARTYDQTSRMIHEMGETSLLLNGYWNSCQKLASKGVPLKWESFVNAYDLHVKRNMPAVGIDKGDKSIRSESKHVQFVREFAAASSTLQTKAIKLKSINHNIEKSISEIETCPYQSKSFQDALEAIQLSFDELNLENYVNLLFWVNRINMRLREILAARLEKAIRLWIDEFSNSDKYNFSTEPKLNAENQSNDPNIPSLDVLEHEIILQNQVISIKPPLTSARSRWLSHLDQWLAIVCTLKEIQPSRYGLGLDASEISASRFFNLSQICQVSLSAAYDALSRKMRDIADYAEKWFQFQSLWDLQIDQVHDYLRGDLSLWLQLLNEIRKARSTFDTSEVVKSFGHLTIIYEQAQAKVTAKYDQWQHTLILSFANKMGIRVNEVFTDIQATRKDLERQSLETSSTAQAVTFITVVQRSKKKVKAWAPEVEIFRKGQTTLSRQRYQPANWLPVERVDDEWAVLNDLLDRKSKTVEDQLDALKAKVIAEDNLIHKKIEEIVIHWAEKRPVSGETRPEDASSVLAVFEKRVTNVITEEELVSRAKEALDFPVESNSHLTNLLEEINDFKSVWAALSTIWNSINNLREMLWNSVQTRKLRQSLEELVRMSKDMPSRMRQYAAFDYVQSVLRNLLKVNLLLQELRSEAIRERHWHKIFKLLKPSKRYSPLSMTLGDVWDLQPFSSELTLRNVISQAQGEMALEEFVKQVREMWNNYTLDMVNYQNKCRLIRGWDDLFAKCAENLNSLQAMKFSPYYKEFEEEASTWEERLNKIHALFDIWIDVQRQWVYLEGVFMGNADIKHLLPSESNRFQNINNEFHSLMKKVYRSPMVLDVLSIAGVQKSLERLLELLQKIQKSLGEYLERERVSFPRFYFVGDEDLLELIGNSTSTTIVAKHIKKMFSGISDLVTDENSTIIGIKSKEGETVNLTRSVSLARLPKINEWLSALDRNVKYTLAELLATAVESFQHTFEAETIDNSTLQSFIDAFPAQIVILATQVCWTTATAKALEEGGSTLAVILEQEIRILKILAASVLEDVNSLQRKKYEHLITECVHQRDILDSLIICKANSPTHHNWVLQMRYIYNPNLDILDRLKVVMAHATLDYGFEYLGVPDRLVRTPLIDRCFLTLTQAICQRLGGSPYGPAGTGKTESVKALGNQLGRFTIVFCCDETFDFQAVGRIFLGICQVGAWGCFDEFNRLEERILSAVSQQIQNIQMGLRRALTESNTEIELVGRNLKVDTRTGIFITMNPGYAGRSNLPDNLKKLFRSIAMSKPDKELIAEVMLFSQGFTSAKKLSKQVVPFFGKCILTLSNQAHYDFGLRALKSVLVNAGGLKRTSPKQKVDHISEAQIILQSLRETVAPKLLRHDAEKMKEMEKEEFPGVEYVPAPLDQLREAIGNAAVRSRLVVSKSWLEKILQLYQIQKLHHGVMLVGPSGSGKSKAWKTLLEALQEIDNIECVFHVIDPKVMSKESLYGSLDGTTREWTDGLFTSILRKVVENLRGEDTKRHWIIFDGDVDPEWVENLNSVLDDNKILTLPNGERLVVPPNLRIVFEVETLKYATMATVSRCGMVWFSEDIITGQMLITNYLSTLREVAFEDLEDDVADPTEVQQKALHLQTQIADVLETSLTDAEFLSKCHDFSQKCNHIMTFTYIRALNALFSLLNRACRNFLEYSIRHVDFSLEAEKMEAFVKKKLLLALIWSFTGDCSLSQRKEFGDFLVEITVIETPILQESQSLIDYNVTLPLVDWQPWHMCVPRVEVNTHSITQTDAVIPTVDTVRHEEVIYSWLAEHKPLILCGPPGSGKTMTLFSALRKLPNMEVIGLNFSSATTPELLMKTFEQYCEYRKTSNGVMMTPTQIGQWLVVFCDEINLPTPDKYGTQKAITFLRQLVEQNGFWRIKDKCWITLDRIQFVGACNPPGDAGRSPLASRFLRHSPLIMVDYPGESSLHQIYGTFNSAVLKMIPSLRGNSEALTKAMVQLYLESQKHFNPEIQPHYIYSPRELTRWVRGIYEAIRPLESLSIEDLVRIWAHEALRLFQDRLVLAEERDWTRTRIHHIALDHFPTLDEDKALREPILFSNWLSKHYVSVERSQLREFVKARLKTFCEEELDVPLVLFDEVLEHVLRIDRVFRQSQGHLILIGTSGGGKTTLSRYVAWMNGLKVYQIKVHGRYSADDFDDDLRQLLRRCGCKAEKICFILDESNVLDSGFLERMNTLLANAEIPGLFEGDEYAALMTSCKEGAQSQGLLLDSQDELYRWFTQQIAKNLHVVFTMNPPEEGLASKVATSPALFNRCVLNWFGDWSNESLLQVGSELTSSVDLDRGNYIAPENFPHASSDISSPISHRHAVVNAMVHIHHSLHDFGERLRKQQKKVTFLTPRHFLDFVAQFVKLYNEKREDLEEQQRHLNVGLEKLRETVQKVSELRSSLAVKKAQLETKDVEANEKLQKMVADQQVAEQRKAASLEVQAALDTQEGEIAKRKDVVLHDLALAEPAVLEAQKSVSNIKKQHLTEVRSMQNPPAGVKLALEAVCTLLGHRPDNWKSILGIVRRDDFIASIVNYDNEHQMSSGHRLKMKNEYLSKEEFTFERVNRASKACGPLVQWVEAQVKYSEILNRVGPLREEVIQLEEDLLQTKAEAEAMYNTIRSLEQSIAKYKAEYAALVIETQSIREEMSRVQYKVDRSVKLLSSLSLERSRWEQSSKGFETQTETIVGDVLVAAALITYAGYYDQQYRRAMLENWLHHLTLSCLNHKTDNLIADYLSTADERSEWQENSLPVDSLCTENAIMLKRFNRYPLIIDPTGRIPEFLSKECKDRRLTVTSFLDSSFVKLLESSLRFGNPILIQDAEYIDPILNHVLNREYQKTGGRVLIQLGKQEIDFSPSFRLYLSTRDPSAKFSPDVCSRTTLVNFTVTQSSLQAQSLNNVLKSERPGVDERRSNLMKLRGEFAAHLRQLEKRLLQALNDSQGNILDDDRVIETLETLKKEAGEITAKAAEIGDVMKEVERITQQYNIIAQSCSAIYSVLEHLYHLNHFYQFSLKFFQTIFEAVLKTMRGRSQPTEEGARINLIVRELFIDTYKRTSLAMLQKDRITLALLLAQASPYAMDKRLFDVILDEDIKGADLSSDMQSKSQNMRILSQHPLFRDHFKDVAEAQWSNFLSIEFAEQHVPVIWDHQTSPIDSYLKSLIIVKMLRLDRFIPATELLVVQVFGDCLLKHDDDLDTVVNQVSALTPISMSSSPGFDASYKVGHLAERLSANCTNVAMGSVEALASAEKAVSNAAAVGSWVLVKNVHLAPLWLQNLEKRLNSLKPHVDFRLFLSMETVPSIPANVLRASRILMYEQPAGIKANMKDSLSTVSTRASREPVERARLYILLSFLHAVFQERLRYAPNLGWTGFWEFNNSDVSNCNTVPNSF